MEQTSRSAELPPTPEQAAGVFGDRLGLAEAYVRHLATTGTERGLIGPREVPRLWERHVLNCAVMAPAFAATASVADVGSGAGLPGLVLAIVRPDLQLTLIEPLERRTTWLTEVVTDLGLEAQVTVARGRAEQWWDKVTVDAVTSRAVASLAEVVRLSAPLAAPGGQIVAMKGQSAEDELLADAEALDALGIGARTVTEYGEGVVDPVTRVVSLDLVGEPVRVNTPVGDGPAMTAARKRARRREKRQEPRKK